jgi:hypothetical protein
MMEATTLVASIALGALIGRWWSIALAVPAGFIAQSVYSFEGFSNTEVGILFGIATVVGLAVGTVLRKGLRLILRA